MPDLFDMVAQPMGSIDLLTVQAGTRAQAPPVMRAERHRRRGSQATWPPTLPVPAVRPAGYGPCTEKPAPDLPWRLAAGTAPWGSTRSHGGSTRLHGHPGRLARLRLRCRDCRGSSGKMSPCFPDDQAQWGGCRGPDRACGSVPADRPRRFPQVTRADRSGGPVLPLLSACGSRAQPALSC